MKRTTLRWNSQFDCLEARSMLSAAPATPAAAVESAFVTYVTKYLAQEKAILLSGSTPASNRSTFDLGVGILLNNLKTSVDSAISTLPTAGTLTPAINAQLVGVTPNSLQSELTAIASPASTSAADVKLFNSQAFVAVGVAASTVIKEVTLATPPTPGPTGNALISYEVSTGLAIFQAEYQAEVGSVLFAPNPTTGNINLTTNRVVFNAAVAANITQLQNTLLAAVSTLGSSVTTTLDPAITSAVASLKAQLLAVPTPTGGYTSSAIIFSTDSNLIINNAVKSLTALVTAALPTG